MTASEELNAYLEELVVAKSARAGDDLLGTLAVDQLAVGAMTAREIAVLGQLLLVAGHDTTASMIALGTAALLAHPDQLRILRETDDPRLVAAAVDELLRYLSITHTKARRVALDDIEIGGQTIRAGDGVIVVKSAANRDARAFPAPSGLTLGANTGGIGIERVNPGGSPAGRCEQARSFSLRHRCRIKV